MIDGRNRLQVNVEAEHRDGKGNLISRTVSLQSPAPPSCNRPKCIWRFFLRVIFSELLSTYHRKRVVYAEKKRHKKIPLKYRTGEGSPETIMQAILMIIKLSIRR